MRGQEDWRNEVEDAISPRIGKMYVLTYHNPKESAVGTTISINGKEFPLEKRSASEFEHTEVTEVIYA